MGKLSRSKGRRFEQEVARRLSVAGRTPVERNLHEVRDGRTTDLQSDLPLIIECRVGKRPNVWKAVREADEASQGTGRYAVAVVRRNGVNQHQPNEDIVAMPMEDFEMLLAELRASGTW